jgi:hypothetical protein
LNQAESYIEPKCAEEISNVIEKYSDIRKSMMMFKMPNYLNQFGDYDACQIKSDYQYVFSSIHGIPRDSTLNISIGSSGKYFSFGSVICICVPSSCPKWYIET